MENLPVHSQLTSIRRFAAPRRAVAGIWALVLAFLASAPVSAADNFLVTTTTPQTAGAAFTITVTARTGTMPDAAYVGTVSLTSSDVQAVLPGNYLFVAGDNGVRQFTTIELRTAGVQTITATDVGTPATTGTSANITVNPATATQLVVSGFADPVTAGMSGSVTVTARDQFNNVDVNYAPTVTITSTDGAAILPSASTLTSGTKLFAVELRTAGERSITATAGALSGLQTAITVQPATATQLVVSGFADPVTAGMSGSVTVTARDQFNNVDVNYAPTVTITSTDGAAILPSASTLTSGTKLFAVELRTAGERSITASGGLLSGSQSAITVQPATAATLVFFTAVPAGGSAGVALSPSPVVQINDAYGNRTSDTRTVTATKASGTGALQGATSVAAVNGRATFSNLRFNQAGDKTLDFTSSPALGTLTTGTIAVGAGSATKVRITAAATSTAGIATTISLRLEDAFDNLVNFDGVLAVDITGALDGLQGEVASLTDQAGVARPVAGSATANLLFAAGVASTVTDPDQCKLALMRAGVTTVGATTSTLTAANTVDITVQVGTPSKLWVTGVGSTTPTAGQTNTIGVQVLDIGGNAVNATSAVTLVLSAAPTSGSLALGYADASIASGSSSTTITNVVLKRAESGVVVTVADQAAGLTSAATANLTVLNDTPLLTIDNVAPLSYVGGSGTRVLDANATISDVSSSLPNYFAGGTLTASFSAGGLVSEDVLLILSSAPIITTGGNVFYNDLLTQIGTYTGGTANTTLTITLNANATPTVVDALVKKLAYFNLAGTVPTISARTVQIQLTDGDGAPSAFAMRTVITAIGNEVPNVVRNTGLTVQPSIPLTAITATNLLTTDLDNTAVQLRYTVKAIPNQGNLELSGVPVVVNGTFTQADIDGGLLQYRYVPGPLPSVSFTFIVDDGVNQPLPIQAFVIAIQGAAQNPIITLPSGTLTYVEQSVTAAVNEASAPNTAQTGISDSFSPSYDNSTLDIEFVDGASQPFSHPGDQLLIRNQTADCPLPVFWPQNPDYSTGWIAVSGGVVYHRQYPFYYYWANNYPGFVPPYTVFAGTFPSPSPPVFYPASWYWGIPMPLDYAIADIDPLLDGTNGKKLRLRLRNGVAPIPDYFFGTTQHIVSSSSVSRLIANTAFRSTSFDPPTTTRSLRFTLTVGATTGTSGVPVGVISRPVQITPVNDPPNFLTTSLALTTLAGIPLNAVVAATDQEAAQTRTYSIVSNSAPASGTVSLNSSTGGFTFVPQTAFAGTTVVVIRATDSLGASTGTLGNPADATVTITTLAGTTSQQPFVVSDPPFEVEEGSQFGVSALPAYSISVLTNATRGPTSVTVQLVGNFPAGTTVTAGPVATSVTAPYLASFSLTSALPISRPPGVSYQFGLRVIANYGLGVFEVGYQPITLRVRALGAPN